MYFNYVEEINMERFFIMFSNNGDDGYVDYENKPSNNLENCEFFKTEEDCQKYIDNIQPEWSSKLYAQKIVFQTTINQLYDCVGCVVTDGTSFARVEKKFDSPHKLFYKKIERESVKNGEPVILVADFKENCLGE
jgi:hypothetical protein